MNFFETSPECSLRSNVLKKNTKMIGHHAGLRDVMGQSYPIHACTNVLITRIIHPSTLNFEVAGSIV